MSIFTKMVNLSKRLVGLGSGQDDTNVGYGSTVGKRSVNGRDKILNELMSYAEFDSILDVGCGQGDFFIYLDENNKKYVGTGVDMVPTEEIGSVNYKYIEKEFLSLELEERFDLVFCSHTIEHVPDTGAFINKLFSLVKDGGFFCLIWPPPKKEIVGGHVHVFNMGLMVYNLVRSGIDCSEIKMFQSGYNLAILGQFKRFELPTLTFNRFELASLEGFFPFPVQHGFDGRVNKYVKKL